MSYYNYHAKAQNLIKAGHCKYAEILEKHNKISPALVLHFENSPPMPIRQHRWTVYITLLKENDIPILNKKDM